MQKTGKKTFSKELMAIVVPVALQSLLSSLVSASDALMLGFLDQSSLSAISLATQIAFVLSLFHMAFATGVSILAAQYWGIEDRVTVEKVLGISLKISVPVSALFSLAAFFIPGTLMRIFTSDPELIALGIPYLKIVSITYLITGFSQMYLTLLRNSGRVTKSSVFSSVAVVLNILLNLVLIFGWLGIPAMGIRGAALATVIARVVELILCIIENRKRDLPGFRLSRLMHKEKALTADYYRYMFPVLLNYIAWGGGVTMFSVIIGHLGSDAVAANSITNIVKNVLLCFCTGIGAGSGIMVGNRLGAGELEEAKETGRKLLTAAVIFGAIAGVILLLLVPVRSVFSRSLSETSSGYLKIMMLISSYHVIGKSLNSTMVGGIFTAGGDTRFGFICDLINMWAFVIPLASLAAFVFKWPVPVVYFLLNLDEICKIPFEIHHYRKYKWVKNLTTEKENEI